MKAAMTARGHTEEYGSTCYYTTDNLHPSWRGYDIYLNECVKVFDEHLLGLKLKSSNLYSYGVHLPEPKYNNLITLPTYIAPEKLNFSGDAKILDLSIKAPMFNTTPAVQQRLSVTPYQHQLYITAVRR